jgi:hypothetical protein
MTPVAARPRKKLRSEVGLYAVGALAIMPLPKPPPAAHYARGTAPAP